MILERTSLICVTTTPCDGVIHKQLGIVLRMSQVIGDHTDSKDEQRTTQHNPGDSDGIQCRRRRKAE